ncbi:juvenile hormone acid O-methyltransferase-like isoform X2 [Amblyomma americanum]
MSQEKNAVTQILDLKSESAELYDAGTDLCIQTSTAILDLFSKAFALSDNEEQQQFIEIGCGPGGFTMKTVFPSLPPCRRLVYTDKSEEMLKVAVEKYSNPRIQHPQLDILGDVSEFVRREGQFQRLYCFQVLHWIRDQRMVIRNFEKLLAPGGQCLVVFLRGLVFCELFEKMMKSPRWSKYSQIGFAGGGGGGGGAVVMRSFV